MDKIKAIWLNATNDGNLERVKCLLNRFPMLINRTDLKNLEHLGHLYHWNFGTGAGAGEQAMLIAMTSGHLDIVKYLTEEVIGIDKVSGLLFHNEGNVGKITPLHFAAKKGHLDIMKYLMEEVTGINKEPKDNFELRPIHYAAMNDHVDIMKYLMEEVTGIEKEPIDGFGMRPIHWAIEGGHLDSVKYLMSTIAEKEPITEDGRTPLDLAKGNVDFLDFLDRCHEVVKFLENYYHEQGQRTQ